MKKILSLLILLVVSTQCNADLVPVMKVEKYDSKVGSISKEAKFVGNILGEKEKKELVKEHKSLLVERINHEKESLKHASNVIYASYIMSIVMFFSVHMALFSGLYISLKEINTSNKMRENSKQKDNEVSISINSISIKTALNGVIVFTLTIILYFSYIKFIYPVTVIDLTKGADTKLEKNSLGNSISFSK